MAEKDEQTRAVRRWDPFGELDPFEGWFPLRGLGAGPGRLARALAEESRDLIPAVEVSESDGAYVITVELPGAARGDVNVEVHDNVLTIRGHKRSEREEKKEHRRVVERRYGSFARSFTLPANAAVDRVKASFDNGVLTVEVPKSEEQKPRVISIQS